MTDTGNRCQFVLIGLLAALVLTTPATAADISKSTGADQQTTITLAGDIVKGDGLKFSRLLKDERKRHPVALLKLNSRGGLIGEAVEIAKLVRAANITTRVASGARCSSACSLVFVAGKQKIAEPTGNIGVHRGRDLKTGKDSKTATETMARVLRSYGVPEQIIRKLESTNTEAMSWLSPHELYSMHVTLLGEPWIIEIGMPTDQTEAKERLKSAGSMASSLLAGASGYIESAIKGSDELNRVRFVGLSKESADAACDFLKRNDIACKAFLPGATVTSSVAPKRPSVPAAAPGHTGKTEQGPDVPLADRPTITTPNTGWTIHLGVFPDESQAGEQLKTAQRVADSMFANAKGLVERVNEGSQFYRAVFTGLNNEAAEAACTLLKQQDIVCIALRSDAITTISVAPQRPGVLGALPVRSAALAPVPAQQSLRLKDQDIPARQRVLLYEEDPANASGKKYIGSATWRTDIVSPGAGQPAEPTIRAEVEIPERRISMTMSIRRNTYEELPASHTVEIMFNLPADFPFGGMSRVSGILMKQTEQASGVPLAGSAVKVTSSFFLVGLSAVKGEMQRNMELLRERGWFDIPIVYNNGRRAILAIEKGAPGERAIADAFSPGDTRAKFH